MRFSISHTVVWFGLLLLGALSLVGCGGGGGGGGGGGNATVLGTVLRGETNAPPNPAATVTIAGRSATTDADGKFTLTGVSASATTAAISAQGAQTLNLPIQLTNNQNNDLGTIFLSDTGYTANVTGRVVSQEAGQPVGNATVILAGFRATTGTNGTFQLNGLPVGLGNVSGTYGVIRANGFEDKPITAETLQFPLEAGPNPLGDILIASPVGSTPPNLPFTIAGTITVNGQKPTAPISVALIINNNTLGTTLTDNDGRYTFWVALGTYSVSVPAQQGLKPARRDNIQLTRLDTPVTVPVINLTP